MKHDNLYTYLRTLLLITTMKSTQSLHRSLTQIRYNTTIHSILGSKPRSHSMPYITPRFHSHQQFDQKTFEQNIAKYLPQFFENNKKMLETIQQKDREAVIVIGQPGVGKRTLIDGLMGHKFVMEKKETKEICDGKEVFTHDELLVNTESDALTTGHNKVATHIMLPKVYPDPTNNLMFIDTASLASTGKDSEVLKLCSAIATRSFIEAIGSVRCIIGVAHYKTFEDESKASAFFDLLSLISPLLQNKPFEACTDSMVLACTKVSSNITKNTITNELKKRCRYVHTIRQNNLKQEKKPIAKAMYQALFPSHHDLQDKKDTPFFTITNEDLLRQNTVKVKILPAIYNATKIDKTAIGLPIDKALLDKTKDWLTKSGTNLAKAISAKQSIERQIDDKQSVYDDLNKKLSDKKDFLQQLTALHHEAIQKKKDAFKKYLYSTIQNNTQSIEQLHEKIEACYKEQYNKLQELGYLAIDEVLLYKEISPSYDKEKDEYNYSYDDIPIDHVAYSIWDAEPILNDYVSPTYSVASMHKNYEQGTFTISLKNSLDYKMLAQVSLFTLGLFTPFVTFLAIKEKFTLPANFNIYVKKKHIYHHTITPLTEAIERLKKHCHELNNQQKTLEKEIYFSQAQLAALEANDLVATQLIKQINHNISEEVKFTTIASDFWQEKESIQQTQKDIETITQELNNLQHTLQSLHHTHDELHQAIDQKHIIAYIITQVAPFIDFHDSFQDDMQTCKQYIEHAKQHQQSNSKQEQANEGNDKQYTPYSMQASMLLAFLIASNPLKKQH